MKSLAFTFDYPQDLDWIDRVHVDVGARAWELAKEQTRFADKKDDQTDAPLPAHFANDSLFSVIGGGYAARRSISASIVNEAAQVAQALKEGKKPNEHLYVVLNPMGRGGKWGYAFPFLKAALERRFGKDNVTFQFSGWDVEKNIPVYDHIIEDIQKRTGNGEKLRVRTVGGDGLIGETLTDFLVKAGEKAVWDCPELGAEFSKGGTAGDLPEATGGPRPHNTGQASAMLVPVHIPKAEITWTDAKGTPIGEGPRTQLIPHTLVTGAGARLFILSERLASWSINLKKWHPSLPDIKPFALAKKTSFLTGVGYQVLNILPTYLGTQRKNAIADVRVRVTDADGTQKFSYHGPSLGALVTPTPQVGGIANLPHTNPVVGEVSVLVMPAERWLKPPVRGASTLAALVEASKPAAWVKDKIGFGDKIYAIAARSRPGMEQGYQYAAKLGDTIEIEYDKPQQMCIDGTGQKHYATKIVMKLGDTTPLYVRAAKGSILEKQFMASQPSEVRWSKSPLPTFNTVLNPDSILHHLTPFRASPIEWLDSRAPVEKTPEGQLMALERAAEFERAKLHEKPLTGVHGFDYFGAGTILAGAYGLTRNAWSLEEYDHFMENTAGLGTKAAALIAMGSGSNVLRFYGSVLNYGPVYMLAKGVTNLALDYIWKKAGYRDNQFKHFLSEALPIAGVMAVQMFFKRSTAITDIVPALGRLGALGTLGRAADKLAPLANTTFLAKLAFDAGEYALDRWNGTWHRRPAPRAA